MKSDLAEMKQIIIILRWMSRCLFFGAIALGLGSFLLIHSLQLRLFVLLSILLCAVVFYLPILACVLLVHNRINISLLQLQQEILQLELVQTAHLKSGVYLK